MESVDILLVTYQRIHFLKRIIDEIDKRTLYPHRIIVIDNHSTDGTIDYIKHLKKIGKIDECISFEQNMGQSTALNEGFKLVKSELFVTTQDDLIPPDLRPCWLERLVHLIEKYPDYGAICMRIQRTARLEIDEDRDLIDTKKSMPSVFRIQRKKDLEGLGRPFGRLRHWESHAFANTMKGLKKKYAMATHLYANHIGFMSNNKGYTGEFKDYFTYSPERVKQGEEKPYPDIDQKTNIPIKINHPYDIHEQDRREKRKEEIGHYEESDIGQRDLLAIYCKGRGIDVGCGPRKVCPDAIGIDLFQSKDDTVDMIGVSGDDLWMFKNEELDYIMSSHSLEHFADTKKTLKEWDRVLKKGGILGIITPDGELRPKTIITQGHKVALTKPIMNYLLKRFLNYEVIELRNMPEIKGENAQRCILAVARKT